MSDPITTPEALDALPPDTVMADVDPETSAVNQVVMRVLSGEWAAPGLTQMWSSAGLLAGGDERWTVLFRPDAPTPTPAGAQRPAWVTDAMVEQIADDYAAQLAAHPSAFPTPSPHLRLNGPAMTHPGYPAGKGRASTPPPSSMTVPATVLYGATEDEREAARQELIRRARPDAPTPTPADEPLADVLSRLDHAVVRSALLGGEDVDVITVTVADADRLKAAVRDAVVRDADVPMRTARVEPPSGECPA